MRQSSLAPPPGHNASASRGAGGASLRPSLRSQRVVSRRARVQVRPERVPVFPVPRGLRPGQVSVLQRVFAV